MTMTAISHRRMSMRWGRFALWVSFAGLIGCGTGPPTPPTDKGSEEARKKTEEEITTVVTNLQAAVKAKDADKIWDLLDTQSQKVLEAEALRIKQHYAKLAAEDKSAYETKLGLSRQELAEMTGKLYVKLIPFYDKVFNKIPDSKFEKIEQTAPLTAIVHCTSRDGSAAKLDVFREAVRGWKIIVPIPKVTPEK